MVEEIKGQEQKPEWVSLKPNEVEKLIVDYAKQGNSIAKIGVLLRDKHGVPSVSQMGLKISQVLNKAGIKIQTKAEQAKVKIGALEAHIKKNSHDYSAKRSLQKTIWLAR